MDEARRHRREPDAPVPDAPATDSLEQAGDQARREKLAKIKKAIEDGTYKVSSEEVARKLIEHMLEPKE